MMSTWLVFALSMCCFLFLTTRTGVRKVHAWFHHCTMMSAALFFLSLSSFFNLSWLEAAGYGIMIFSLVPLYRWVRNVS